MAGPKQIRAGAAYVELNSKDRFSAGLKAMGRRFAGLVKSIAIGTVAMGAAAAAGAAVAIKAFASMGSELADASARTGVSVEALSELKFAAEQTGSSFEGLETGIRKMQKTIVDAGAGGKEAVDALDQLGLSFMQLRDLSPEDQFKLIAAKLNKIEDPTARAGMAMKVFGKSGTQLLPMIADLAALEQEFRDLGLTMSGKDATAADKLGDKFSTLREVFKRVAFVVGSALGPSVERMANWLIQGGAAAARWVNENRDAFQAVANTVADVFGWIGVRLKEFSKTAGDILGGIGDALLSGEFVMAGKLVVKQLQMAFVGLKSFFNDLWSGIGNAMVTAMIHAQAEILKTWVQTKNALKKIGESLADTWSTASAEAKVSSVGAELERTKTMEGLDPDVKAKTIAALEKELAKNNAELAHMQDMLSKDKPGDDAGTAAAIDAINKERDAKLASLKQIADVQSKLDQQRFGEEAAAIELESTRLREAAAAAAALAKENARVEAALDDFFGDGMARLPQMPDVDAIDATMKKGGPGSKGTFNAAALQGLAGGAADKIAIATEKTADNTGKLLRATKDGISFTFSA